MDAVFKHDILFGILMPPDFADFANKMISEALKEAGLSAPRGGVLQKVKMEGPDEDEDEDEEDDAPDASMS